MWTAGAGKTGLRVGLGHRDTGWRRGSAKPAWGSRRARFGRCDRGRGPRTEDYPERAGGVKGIYSLSLVGMGTVFQDAYYPLVEFDRDVVAIDEAARLALENRLEDVLPGGVGGKARPRF